MVQEFFERNRLRGNIAGAKRAHGSSAPMHVKYHQLISQDLLSLKTLSDAHDIELDKPAEREDRPRLAKLPLRLDLKEHGPVRKSCDLELPMSPIANPSVLELLDTSTATESLYTAHQPQVSTMKKPVLLLNPYSSTCSTQDARKPSFSLTRSSDVDAVSSVESFPTLPESLFSTRKQQAKPAQTNSLLFTTHGTSKISSNMPLTAVCGKLQLLQQREIWNMSLDTEKPLLPSLAARAPRPVKNSHTSYSWECTDWYGGATARPPLLKKKKSTEGSFHDREVRKTPRSNNYLYNPY